MENKKQEELEEIKWGGLLNELLWTCAGVNKKILRQCPTDYAKYAGIGGTILFTALMAMLSGGYALYTVFDNQTTAVLFGIFWGLLIFNLDRFIVNTMYSDGKVTISWKEFTSGLPRIIMAIFLGIVISTPLELKIFEDEINVTIQEMAQDRIRDFKKADEYRIDSLDRKKEDLTQKKEEMQNSPVSIYDPNIPTTSTNVNKLLLDLKNEQAKLDKEKEAITQINHQLYALSNNDSIRYRSLVNERYKHLTERNKINQEINRLNGELASNDKELKERLDKATETKQQEIDRIQQDIDRVQQEIDEYKSKVSGISKEYEELIRKEFGGFQAHMLAFSQMKEEHESTYITSLFIMLLFIIIETAPTFFKMMIASGPYDDLLRSEMHKARVMSDKRISDLNDEINTEIKISTEKNRNRLEAEAAANKELLDKIATAQAELLSTAIEAWRQAELKKIEKNPEAYIRTNTSNNG